MSHDFFYHGRIWCSQGKEAFRLDVEEDQTAAADSLDGAQPSTTTKKDAAVTKIADSPPGCWNSRVKEC